MNETGNKGENMRGKQIGGLVALMIGVGGIAYTVWACYNAVWPFGRLDPSISPQWLNWFGAVAFCFWWVLIAYFGLAFIFGWHKARKDGERSPVPE